MSLKSILVVEDEDDIRDLIVFNLKREGFTVLEAADGATAISLATSKHPDLILLDLMLPIIDGLSVFRTLSRERLTSQIPVIMLTAKGEELDRIVGLELGAADYVVKPFSMREVILRIKGILKRSNEQPASDILSCGAIRLDLSGHKAFIDEIEVDLTATEFSLLKDLLSNKGQVRTREQLLNTVWGYSFEGYARTVDTHIRRLRAKLGEAVDVVETVRGIGYRARGNNA